jgi:putative tricarboxylic transport membrane protein
VRGPQEFAGGLTLMAIALLALWAARDLGGMRGFSVGAGTMPRLIALVLFGLGAVLAAIGVFVEGERSARLAWRGPLFVGLAILVFAVAIRPLGFLVASFVSFLVAALATPETRWRETVLVAVGLTAVCSLVFPLVLKLPLPLLPQIAMP